MYREWLLPAKVLTGFCALAVGSFAQTYTVSAKPGALNFIQGEVTLNGDPVWKANLKSTFMGQNDVLAVESGKAEVLLTPGVFLRVGEHSQIRMIKPSLTETQFEVVSGESMVEVDDVQPGSSIAVMDHGSATTIIKPGLYRFNETSIAALDGKAEVTFGERRLMLNKNKEVSIGDTLHAGKVDLKQTDDLYAWSNSRALTNAAASYAGSTSVYNAGGYGFSNYSSPGWFWASGFNSYMWLPGNGAFYSPFGWGFYGPGLVAYAPVMFAPSGYANGGYYPLQTTMNGAPLKTPVATKAGSTSQLVVPLNPQNVGSTVNANSPASLMAARNANQNYANSYGLQTAHGTAPAVLRSGQTFSSMQQASHAAVASSRGAASSGSSVSSGGSAGYAGSASAHASSVGGGSAASHSSGGSGGGHSSSK